MTNAELIAKIKAEIERLKNEHPVSKYDESYDAGVDAGYFNCCCELLSFLSTLESGKPVPKNLDEYAQSVEDYHDVGDESGYLCTRFGDIKDAVIAGAKWQKEQMMKEAVDATVHLEPGSTPVIEIGVGRFGLKVRDKVKVIIVKGD